MSAYSMEHFDDLPDGDVANPDTSAVHGSYTVEEALLTKQDVRTMFRRLSMVERVVVALLQRYATPPGYTGPWPPTPAQVGEYLGTAFPEFGGAAVSPRTVVTLNRNALRQMRKWLERGGVHHAS